MIQMSLENIVLMDFHNWNYSPACCDFGIRFCAMEILFLDTDNLVTPLTY